MEWLTAREFMVPGGKYAINPVGSYGFFERYHGVKRSYRETIELLCQRADSAARCM